jgi:hypothetical protein
MEWGENMPEGFVDKIRDLLPKLYCDEINLDENLKQIELERDYAIRFDRDNACPDPSIPRYLQKDKNKNHRSIYCNIKRKRPSISTHCRPHFFK